MAASKSLSPPDFLRRLTSDLMALSDHPSSSSDCSFFRLSSRFMTGDVTEGKRLILPSARVPVLLTAHALAHEHKLKLNLPTHTFIPGHFYGLFWQIS